MGTVIVVQTPTPGILGIQYAPSEGMIRPSRFNPTWFDQTEFQWTTGNAFQAGTIGAGKIQVGSILQVGGKNSFQQPANGQIGVFDSGSNLIGWIGAQQGGQGTAGWSVYGAWFKQLWVGGTQPAYAPLYVDQNGLIVVGGIATQGSGTSGSPSPAPYPYISLQNEYGIVRGQVGAKLAAITTPDGHPFNLAGGWFQTIAIGGNDPTQWNILTDDQSPTNVYMRNVHLFQIDYAQQLSTPPYNSHYLLEMGASVWGAGGMSGASYQFPGLRMYEPASGTLPAVFGSMLINRGLVLRGNSSGCPVLASLVTFNGDSQGSDSGTFWGELTLYPPNSVAGSTPPSVHLASGGGSIAGAAFFTMNGAGNAFSFAVDGNGGATARNGFFVGSAANQKQVIDLNGNWVGNPISGGGGGVTSIAAGTGVSVSASTGAVTISIGQVVATNSAVTFASVTASGAGTFGSVKSNGGVDSVSGYTVSGNPIITSGGVLANPFGIDVAAGCAATGFNIHNGGTGKSASFVVGSTTYTFTNGILTNVA
jgi:hypothetical protein